MIKHCSCDLRIPFDDTAFDDTARACIGYKRFHAEQQNLVESLDVDL